MGLLKHLLFWPVTGPLFLMDFSMEKVEGVVRQELTDDAPVKADLLDLQLQTELGEVDDEEYARREAELMQRLRDIRHWRIELGMSVSGGAVRVADTGQEEAPAAAEAEEERTPQVASSSEATVEFDFGHDD